MAQSPQRITHSHLRILDSEPHLFERLYVEGLELPTIPGNSAAIERGKQFHQLVQQQALGLPIASLVESDPNLRRYFRAFQTSPPPLLNGPRHWEYPLALPLQNFQLYGVVDVLVETPERAQIVDWKTYGRSLSSEALAFDWQTRLYFLLVTETRNYLPEQLSMLYWFTEEPQHWVEVAYDSDTHIRNLRAISILLESLDKWLSSGFPRSSPPQQVAPEGQPISNMPPLPLP